jgi:hypothetical protein
VDAASTGVFRILIGLLVLGEVIRWLSRGWIEEEFLAPAFLFKYYGFEWVAPLSGTGLHLLFAAIAALAILVTVGLWYRVAVVALWLSFAYVFLLNQAIYLNQYYLLLLCLLLLCVTPADREYSVRARRLPQAGRVVPRWSMWALRWQFEVMLVYAGLVKLSPDWLAGQPLGLWFGAHETRLATVSTWLSAPGAAVVASYAVVLLHLVGAPLLLWRRTRFAVFCLYLLFHLTNATLLTIGLFPWITLAGTLMFFDPDWPRVVASRLGLAASPQAPRLEPGGAPLPTRPWVFPFLAVFFPRPTARSPLASGVPRRCRLDPRRFDVRVAHEARRSPRQGALRGAGPGHGPYLDGRPARSVPATGGRARGDESRHDPADGPLSR